MSSGEKWSFSKWYSRHRDKLNRDRRLKYEEDGDYRRKVLDRNRASRKRRKAHEQSERATERQASFVSTQNRGWKVVDACYYNSGDCLLCKGYTVGILAAVLGRSLQTIRAWTQAGVIPDTPLRSARGDRVYTAEMIEEVVSRVPTTSRRKARSPVVLAKVRYPDGTTQLTKLYRIRMLAEAINRTRDAVIVLETEGRIPSTPLRSKGGQRLYTAGMILSAKAAFEDVGWSPRGLEAWSTIFQRIADAWLPVIGAVVEHG